MEGRRAVLARLQFCDVIPWGERGDCGMKWLPWDALRTPSSRCSYNPYGGLLLLEHSWPPRERETRRQLGLTASLLGVVRCDYPLTLISGVLRALLGRRPGARRGS